MCTYTASYRRLDSVKTSWCHLTMEKRMLRPFVVPPLDPTTDLVEPHDQATVLVVATQEQGNLEKIYWQKSRSWPTKNVIQILLIPHLLPALVYASST